MPRIAAEMEAVTVPSAVVDQLDARPGVADLLDQVVVARPVEDDRRDVVRAAAECLRDREDILAHRSQQVDRAARTRSDRELPHVHVGQLQERAGLPDGDHRHRAVAAPRDDAAALERVEGEVDGLSPGSDRSPGGERRLVVGRPDHDAALDRERVENAAHRLGGVVLGRLVICPPEPACTREGCALGHTRVRLATTEVVVLRRRLGLGWLWNRLGHETGCTSSAAASTRSITRPIARSRFALSTTGTSWRSARATIDA